MPLSIEGLRWRDCCRRIVRQQERSLAQLTRAGSVGETAGIGAGGDVSIRIDREFERVALEEIDRCFADDATSQFVITEERGEPSAAAAPSAPWVILDPVDGSTNAANGLPSFSFCAAVASGPTMAETWFGFVHDFGAGEEFVCERGRAVEVNGFPIPSPPTVPSRLVAFESAEPALVARALDRVARAGVKEIRVVGSIAIALCWVGLGRVEGLITCKQCRSVDAAAAQLFASALGVEVRFDGAPPASAGLRLAERYRLVAARGSELEDLLDAQRLIPLVPR